MARVKTVRVDSQRVCMNREDLVMPEEEDLIERACTYLLEHRYPDGCSSNEKRIIWRKAATLVLRGGEVFYMKTKKDYAGEKVLAFVAK